jgi:hypothetical protein
MSLLPLKNVWNTTEGVTTIDETSSPSQGWNPEKENDPLTTIKMQCKWYSHSFNQLEAVAKTYALQHCLAQTAPLEGIISSISMLANKNVISRGQSALFLRPHLTIHPPGRVIPHTLHYRLIPPKFFALSQ